MFFALINESLNSRLSGYADLIAIVAAVLLVLFLITVIVALARASKLKRENKKLKKQVETTETKLMEANRALVGSGAKPSQTEVAESAKDDESKTDSSLTETPVEETAPAELENTETVSEDEKGGDDEKAEPEEIETETAEESVAEKQPEDTEKEVVREDKDELVTGRVEVVRSSPRPVAKKPPVKKTPVAAEKGGTVTAKTGGGNSSAKYVVKFDAAKQEWIVLKTGNTRATRRVRTKQEALAIAKELSKSSDTSLVVHKKDGKFQKQ